MYPQPNSELYAADASADFYRLKTKIFTPGDIYESKVGCHAIALGPDSDLYHLNVGYFNQQENTFLSRALISPDRAFIGNIVARNDAQYAPASVPGRILFWPEETWDPNANSNGNLTPILAQQISVVRPTLDVIQYFGAPPSVLPERNDKSYYFESLDTPNSPNHPSQEGTVILPYYGRRYGYIRIINTASQDLNLTILGINYTRTGASAFGVTYQITTLRNAVTVPHVGNIQLTTIIKADTDGMFDAIAIGTAQAGVGNIIGPYPITVYFSDKPR